MSEDIKKFYKKLQFTNGKYDEREIFKDIIMLTSTFIIATMLNDKKQAEEFDNMMKKYTIKEQQELWYIMIELVQLYQKQQEAKDIMTLIFNELGLGNKNTGQFFTPTHISDFMAKVISIDEKGIEENGYVTLHKPTCGAGGMILAYAREVNAKGYSTSRNLYVEAWDIDILCTYMTFLQLALYDIPAKVVNGDTLALKEKFVLYTPAYFIFRQLEKEGKLNVKLCSYCKKEINKDEIKTSKIDSTKKICKECYEKDKVLEVVKDLMENK